MLLVGHSAFQVVREEVARRGGFLDEAGALHERAQLLNLARVGLRDGRFLAELVLG